MEPTKSACPTIRSGTTTERLFRAALLAVVINGFALAFLWDGYFGYARQNVESLVKSLGLSAAPLPAIDPKLTAELGRSLVSQVSSHVPVSPARETLGEPSLLHGDDAYYLGPTGHIKVHREPGKIESVEWVDATQHTTTDLAYQCWIGYFLGMFGLVSLAQLVRVATTRAVLSDQGLRIRGKQLITLEAMHGIRDRRASGGTVEIEYRDGEVAHTVELDGYVYRDRDAIIEAICIAKGLANPLRPDAGTQPT